MLYFVTLFIVGGLNNMIWAPDDCDLIEFNENPDDEHYTQSHGQTSVRRVFLNAFFARSAPMPFHVRGSIPHQCK